MQLTCGLFRLLGAVGAVNAAGAAGRGLAGGGTRAACSRMCFFCSWPAAKYENTHRTA